MNKWLSIIAGLLLGGVFMAAVLKLSSTPSRARIAPLPAELNAATGGPTTPADREITGSLAHINARPDDPQGYNSLADAFMQKARETGDFSLNDRARVALEHSLQVAPNNPDAVRLQAKLLLTLHQFPEALAAAERARTLKPNDAQVYGALTDALVELGRYPEALQAVQQMVNLRPDADSYARVSYLRELHGDLSGALEAMRQAALATNPQDVESTAWVRVHYGLLLLANGQRELAETEFANALRVFPDYHAARAAQARARLHTGDITGAIDYYRQAQNRVPLPDYALALGDLYQAQGQQSEAEKQYALVEAIERAGAVQGTYSRQLAMFWADRDQHLDAALATAEREYQQRQDIYTCDALAWTLYKNGRHAEAQAKITEALRLNTRDPRLLFHAGLIALKNGDNTRGHSYLRDALALDPQFDALQAAVARQALAAPITSL